MKLTFKKGYNGDVNTLPSREVEGAVAFREPETIGKFALVANAASVVILILAAIPLIIVFLSQPKASLGSSDFYLTLIIGLVLSVVVTPVHELLHAICFREEVAFYTALKLGLLFVIGTESMSKARFVFMSMLPNLVFGFIPYILYFVIPAHPLWLGVFGAACLCSGAGDYINVFHAVTQMPKGAKCYLSKNRSYWYLDNSGKNL